MGTSATPKLAAQAGKLNIVIEQGATFNPVFTYTDENDALIDLTGYTARMQLRDKVASTTILDELTTENGGITLGATLGTIALLFTATQTAAMSYTKAVYDLELINTTSVVTRLLQGSVEVSKETTR
jgi:hypothetical protein